MNIQFDEKNLLADMVGSADGVTRAEAERSQSKALRALKAFKKQSEANIYGFPHLPFQKPVIESVRQYAAEVRGSYDTVCLVGIGGSALGAWALDCGIRGPHPVQGEFTPEHPRLVILDNVDPSFIAAALDSMDPRKTLVVVVAKSGGTAETVATFLIVSDWLEREIGRRRAATRIAAVTTEGEGDLFELARAEKYRTFGIPKNVGGRFSVLSPAGRAKPVDGPEREHLVVRTFDVQLHLRVLIGRTQGRDRRLPHVHLVLLPAGGFAQRLCPELAEPKRRPP